MFEPQTLLVLIPALPLAACLVTVVLGPHVLRDSSHWPTVLGLVGSLVLSLMLVASWQQRLEVRGAPAELLVTCWSWVDVAGAYRQAPAPPSPTGVAVQPGGLRDLRVDVVLRADALTAIMLVMVTFVSTLVGIYSIGYMRGDRGYWRFFACISLFVFSMTMLVSVSNFLLVYVFWEAVGVCSYLLIGFWYQKPEAAAAGKKAFLVNRVGDVGFALAIFLIWITYGTLNFHDSPGVDGVLGQARLSGALGYVGGGVGLAICLCLLLGACGKSAQFPLHVWLPDAMEGPTPVSALIHAATMVTAGVYLVTRCAPLFTVSPEAQLVVASIGGFTALLAALMALTQFDLKRILAYSTISQLGYMFLALGTGTLAGITAGMFHLFTHAFFKALLFLGAGSVMHAMGHVIDMRRFGGLRRVLPVTHVTFAVGCLALAGVFPLSGFWSKDAILASVHERAHQLDHELAHRQPQPGAAAGHTTPDRPASDRVVAGVDSHARWDAGREGGSGPALSTGQLRQHARVYRGLYWVGLGTAFLTAIYTFRAFFLTFYGRERIPHEAGEHAHESPRSMVIPLVILAVGAAVVGGWLTGTGGFARLLAETPSLTLATIRESAGAGGFHYDIAVASSVAALVGIGLAAFLYLGHDREIELLTWLLDGRWLKGLAERPWGARLAGMPLVAAIRRGADAAGLGSLARLLGNLVLLLILLLISPLLIGYYVSPYRLSRDKFFLDEIYAVLVVWPLRATAAVCDAADRWLVDGLVNVLGRIPVWAGGLMRALQMGLVPFYGLAMLLGILTLIAARVLWGAG